MTETITDSFCERCGTRYAFEVAARPRRARLGRVRVLTRGVTTFITNDGMPMAEAMAAARNDEERADLARQLDEFHKTFNFCMGCRQYTCPSCWNAAAGECLTCSPDLTREVLPPPFPDLPATGPVGSNGDAGDTAAAASLAWPSVDLERAAASPAPGPEVEAAWPIAEQEVVPPAAEPAVVPPVAAPTEPAPVQPAPIEAAPIEPVPAADGLPESPTSPALVAAAAAAAAVAAATAAVEPTDDLTESERAEIELALATEHDAPPATAGAPAPEEPPAAVPGAPGDVDAVAAGRDQTRGFLRRFRPAAAATVATRAGDAAPGEPVTAAPEPGPAVEPAALAEPVVEPDVSVVEPVAEREPMPVEPSAVAPEPADAASEPMPVEPAAAAAAAAPPGVDTVEQPTWRMVAPDAPAPPTDAQVPGGPAAWPASTSWPPAPTRDPAPPAVPAPTAAPWAARVAISRPDSSGLWDASSREVLGIAPGPAAPGPGAPAPAAVQACVSCGLSLSATARFCRRCGSRQG